MAFSFLFDLDGVLLDSRELHFTALNLALAEVDPALVITHHEQVTTYEGLVTKQKLEILHNSKGLDRALFETVWLSKQRYTTILFDSTEYDYELVKLFSYIKEQEFSIGVVSNSIRSTLDVCLNKLGIAAFIDVSISNEDVLDGKPSPEGYLKAMKALHSTPKSVAIFEDSVVGRDAAVRSGATLVPVNCRADLTKSLIQETLISLRAVDTND